MTMSHASLGPHRTDEKVRGDVIPGTSAPKLRRADVSVALGRVWAGETQTRVCMDTHAYVHEHVCAHVCRCRHVRAHALTHVPSCARVSAETDSCANVHARQQGSRRQRNAGSEPRPGACAGSSQPPPGPPLRPESGHSTTDTGSGSGRCSRTRGSAKGTRVSG